MSDSSRPSGPGRGNPSDDWSEPNWSDPSYRRESPARRESARSSSSADEWGSPSYSDRERQGSGGAASGSRSNPRRLGETSNRQSNGRNAGNRESGNRNAGSRATSNRGSGSSTAVWPAERAPERHGGAAEREDDRWNKAGPLSARDQRATRAAQRRAEAERTQRSVDKLLTKTSSGRAEAARRREYDSRAAAASAPRPHERGLVWWLALAVLVVITALGAIIDSVAGIDGQNGFNYGIVIASIAAILLVKRSHMFPVVVAPPIVYSVAAVLQLYAKRSSGSNSGLLIDAVQNYLVYGFPALAAATAAALIIAGIRLISRK